MVTFFLILQRILALALYARSQCKEDNYNHCNTNFDKCILKHYCNVWLNTFIAKLGHKINKRAKNLATYKYAILHIYVLKLLLLYKLFTSYFYYVLYYCVHRCCVYMLKAWISFILKILAKYLRLPSRFFKDSNLVQFHMFNFIVILPSFPLYYLKIHISVT